MGAEGLPIISYYDVTHDALKFARCRNVYCTSASTKLLDADGGAGVRSQILTGTDGLPVISYAGAGNTDLRVLHCTTPGCEFYDIAPLRSFGGQIQGMAIGRDGLPVIAHLAGNASLLNLLGLEHSSDVACTAATFTEIRDLPLSATGISLTVGMDGLPIMSLIVDDFEVPRGGDYDMLKVIRCDDPSCQTSTYASVGSGGDGTTSIAIGRDGLPVISYRYAQNWNLDADLHLAHYNDPRCDSYTVATIDNVGDVGVLSSLVIGGDGFPSIAYLDTTNEDLKLAHCRTVGCGVIYLTMTDGAGHLADAANPVVSWSHAAPLDLRLSIDAGVVGTANAALYVGVVFQTGTYWLTSSGIFTPTPSAFSSGRLPSLVDCTAVSVPNSVALRPAPYLWFAAASVGGSSYASAVVTAIH